MLDEGDDDDDGRRALTRGGRGPFDEGSTDECEDDEARSTSPTASFTEHSTELEEEGGGLLELGDQGAEGEGVDEEEGVTIDDSEHESAAGSAVSSLSGSGVRPPHGRGRGMSAPLATSHEFRARARDGASSEPLRAEF